MSVRYIDEIDFSGKRVFLRADLNLPLDADQNITDDTRLQAVLPTIQYLLRHGARLTIASHLGRPKDGVKDPKFSLMPVSARMADLLADREVIQAPEVMSDGVRFQMQQLKEGDVLVLENLRFHAGEKKNDPELAKAFAENIDVYVNDAFGSSHRAHCSIDALPRIVETRCAGFLMRKELQSFKLALESPAQPVIAILGGAKVSDKVGVIENLLDKVDAVLIGGAMAYTFLKALGENVGKSLVEEGKLRTASDIIKAAKDRGVKLYLPKDHVAATAIEAGAAHRVVGAGGFRADEMGLDIGPQSREEFASVIREGKTIIWNGPMGVFEIPEFAEGTFAVARAVAAADGLSVVGGGDSVSAIHAAGVEKSISHISTGGGASLELLEGKILPGIAALES